MAGKLMSIEEAIGIIPDGATVGCAGFGGAGHPEALTSGIEARFLADNRPRDLTLVFAAGQGDGEGRGLDHLGHEGLLRRVIGGHFGLTPRLARLIVDGRVEAYSFPTGVISRLYRAIASEQPGLVSSIGLRTFVDPRLSGGRLSGVSAPDLVEVVEVCGREWLLYRSLPINVALIRGTTADERGNLTMEHEASIGDALSLAQAARNSGGVVLAQVERLALGGSLDARRVRVPGILVDGVVTAPSGAHPQTFGGAPNPSFSGAVRTPVPEPRSLRLRARQIIARRVALELSAGLVMNVGPEWIEDMRRVLAQEGIAEQVGIALESGVVGGVPAEGPAHGAAWNPDALLDQAAQHDFIDGGGLDVAVLSLGQVDPRGNVNVSRFGSRLLGCGAFVNISQAARQVILCGLFTEEAEVALLDEGLTIMRDGARRTFVETLEQVTFSGEQAIRNGQRVLYVTERAVFELRLGRLTLTELAPGIDLKQHVLAHMDFRPEIDSDLRRMDPALLAPRPLGLAARF
ncbi:MAG: acyl CoA:acetate/3-ketoacid CoA transferase [Armatimonadetes bacterium]|nr:acyl CoA:acetate/3-ketoacid CoA transferase [Armatimonadota bacterium]